MWILPKQLHISVYAPDTRALALDSEAFSQLCEKSLTWRGKDSLSRTWLQRWKRESWMQHLCSRTLKPSHTDSFVDSWTSFPEDSRVSHSQLLESVKLLKTPDTSSPTSQTELESANLELFSSKTYKESSVARQPTESQFSSMSSEHWKDWVIEQRQEYSQRKKSAHLIRESESTSLAWPTASVAGCVEGGVAKNVEMTPSGFKATRENGTSYGAKLRDAVETYEKKNWSTPTVMDTANIQKPRKKNTSGGQKPPLCQEVKNWPTASARDWKDTAGMSKERDGKALGRVDQLPRAVYHHDGLQDQANPNTNGNRRESWPTPRETMSRDATYDRGKGNLGEVAQGKLNPDWVEHLMGLPAGWTDLGSWETE